MLAGCGNVIEREFADRLSHPDWAESPFGWIKRHRNATVGAIGVRLVGAWCGVHNVSITTTPGTKSDKRIGGALVEIKFATLGKNKKYMFNQVRTAGYDTLVCMGVSPNDAHVWIIPRDTATQNSRRQHGEETFMLQVDPQSVPSWLQPFGGSLGKAVPLLRRLAGRKKK